MISPVSPYNISKNPRPDELKLNHLALIENDLKFCGQGAVTEELVHLLHLQLSGVCANGLYDVFSSKQEGMYGEIHLKFPDNVLDDIYAVPRKLPVMQKSNSPYTFENGCIYYGGSPVFKNGSVVHVPLPRRNEPRYLKGYSFPFLNTSNPYYELRINPKNTGKCPGRCVFCHRAFSHRFRPTGVPRIRSPKEIVQLIIDEHGKDALCQVSHVSMITELFGRERTFLDYLKDLKRTLSKVGGLEGFSFRACSQDVRSERGLKELYSIVDNAIFSYTLEVFSDRERILGEYKGISLTKAMTVLKAAKKIGFNKIKLNYVAGIDSSQSFSKGMSLFTDAGLVDLLGLSILTSFCPEQETLRHPDAWGIDYYIDILRVTHSLGVSLYEPMCFEMGYPAHFLRPDLPWMQVNKRIIRSN